MVLHIIEQEREEQDREEKDDDLWERRTWKKTVRTVFISLVAAILVVCATSVVLVENSSSVRQGLLAQAEHSIYASTGAHVSARDFHLGFFPPKLDLSSVVVHGSEPEFSQPLLYADHVGAQMNWSSLRYRRWNLRALIVDHAVVHYSVSASGESNLPQPASTLRSTAHVVDVAVEKVQIRGGEVYWNDNKAPLEAELHHMRFTADYEGAAHHYRSNLRYGQGTIRAGNYALLDHALESNFELTPAKLTVSHLALSSGKFRLAMSGSVEDNVRPTVQATYDAQLEAADLEPLLKTALPVAGTLHLAGSLNYRADPAHTALQAVSLSGTATSPTVKLTLADLHADAVASEVGANYKFTGGNAEFENIHGQMFGGSLTASLSVHDVGGDRHATLQAHLKDASLERLQGAMRAGSAPDARLSGQVQADGEASWYTGFKDLVTRGNATLQGTLGATSATPLHAVIHAEYEAAGRKLSFRQSYLKTAQTTLTLEGNTGSVGDKSSLQVSLNSGNLHEVELLAGNFPAGWDPWSGFSPLRQPSTEPSTTHAAPPSIGNLGLYGTATFTASITESAGVPQLKGQLEARNLRVKGTSWKLLHTDIEMTPSSLTFSNGSLEAALPEQPKAVDSPRPGHAAVSSLPFRKVEQPEANLRGPIPNAGSK